MYFSDHFWLPILLIPMHGLHPFYNASTIPLHLFWLILVDILHPLLVSKPLLGSLPISLSNLVALVLLISVHVLWLCLLSR